MAVSCLRLVLAIIFILAPSISGEEKQDRIAFHYFKAAGEGISLPILNQPQPLVSGYPSLAILPCAPH